MVILLNFADMKNDKFSFSARIRSFRYAFHGIATLLHDEHNFRIHGVSLIIAITLGVLLRISPMEWCIVALCSGGVLTGEATNSAIEALSDLTSPEYHPLVKKAKDVAAAGVLMMAIAAAVCGGIIFLPKIIAIALQALKL